MSARWIVEEEYIERSTKTDLDIVLFAREARLVNQKGDVLVRRLAYHAVPWENCLLLQGNHCISYRETDVFSGVISSPSPALRSLLISNQALLMYDWDFELLSLSAATKWCQQQREQVSIYRVFGLYQANCMTVSTYQCESLSQAHRVEWRVYSVSEHLGGFPVYRELLVDNHLVRRHKLLYRRPISDGAALVWMRLPRGLKPRPEPIDRVLRFAGYQVFQFDDMGKAL